MSLRKFGPGRPPPRRPHSNTRVCAACDAPMILGKRDCQECGSAAWSWRDGLERDTTA